jgi:hypothetical protein
MFDARAAPLTFAPTPLTFAIRAVGEAIGN